MKTFRFIGLIVLGLTSDAVAYRYSNGVNSDGYAQLASHGPLGERAIMTHLWQNSTGGKCDCAITSGNKDSCCSSSNGKGMATGDFCGSNFHKTHCGGETPLCCTSSGRSQCCPSDHTCSYGCKGGGGGGLGPCQCVPPPPPSNASRQYVPALAKTMAWLARASYCGPIGYGPRAKNLLKWTCKEECKDSGLIIDEGSVRTITRNDRNETNVTFAWVGRWRVREPKNLGEEAPRTGDCMVGFPGSMNGHNWRRNFQFAYFKTGDGKNILNRKDQRLQGNFSLQLRDADKLTGDSKLKYGKVKVHKGFYLIWSTLEDGHDGVSAHLRQLGCGPGSGRKVFVTGQSLGGAAATVSMVGLRNRGFTVGQSYVFNSPRIGNKAFARRFDRMFGREVPLFRITIGKDPINRICPSNLGFSHVGSEVYFPNDWYDRETEDNYVVCQGREDRACSRRHSVARTSGGYTDHCKSSLVTGGNICAWTDFCNNETVLEEENAKAVKEEVVKDQGLLNDFQDRALDRALDLRGPSIAARRHLD